MSPQCALRVPTRRGAFCEREPRGFSLIEVIVALAVISIAVSVYARMLMTSVDLAKVSRNQYVAARLADGQLGAILLNPGQFQWDLPDEPTADLFPVRLGDDDPKAGNTFIGPGSTVADVWARRRQEDVYAQFRWKAQARLPETETGAPEAAYYEVTVFVQWEESGRPRQLALTSAVARNRVEGAP